jgi:predicted AAA+ superfamily ATPase
MFSRFLKLEEVKEDSLFLWGARQVGKSTLLETLFPESPYYDLLKSEEFERLFRKPSLLREELIRYDRQHPVIIDEIQKIPQLLDEVHWLMTNSIPESAFYQKKRRKSFSLKEMQQIVEF